MNTTVESSVSFEELYRTCSPRLFKRACFLLGDQDQAADVVQETFVKAWRAWPPATQTNLSSWLYTIATNTAVDVLRSRRALVCSSLESVVWHLEDAAPTMQERSPVAPNVHLWRAFDRLTSTSQRVLLAHVQGLSLSEIAQMHGLQPRTCSQRLYDAKARLRQLYLQQQEVSA